MNLDVDERAARLRKHWTELEELTTPLYVFFEADLRRNYHSLRGALDDHYPDSKVHFAAKANYNTGVLSVLEDAGCGAEAYSGCELTAAMEAGFDPGDILLTGMNRSSAEIERALAEGVEHLLVDNAAELERVEAAAAETDDTTRVLLRGNPAMEVPTNPDVATATRESKFGLDIESGRAMSVAETAVNSEHVTLAGVQLHIGSQIRGVEPYAIATRLMLEFAADIEAELGVEIDVLDMGGGFPIPYDEDVPATDDIVETIGETIEQTCDDHNLTEPTLFLEPGRRLVGNAGALLGSVGVVKETPHSTFAVLDVGTNAVSSYWPYPIYALQWGAATERYDVAGPLCFTGDVIQEDVALPPLEQGDMVVVDRVGAYSLSSATHTNAEPKPPVVMVRDDGSIDLIRPGENCSDILGDDQIPEELR